MRWGLGCATTHQLDRSGLTLESLWTAAEVKSLGGLSSVSARRSDTSARSASKGGRHMMRRLGKIAGYLTLGLLLVVLFTYYSIINPLFDTMRDPLVRKVMKIVSQSFNGILEVGTLRGSLLG